MGAPVWALFGLWLAYGALHWRRSSRWFERASSIPRERRPALATLWLLGGGALLLGTLYGVYATGGFPAGGIAPWAWAVCLVAGIGFVHAQVAAGVLLVSTAVTPRAARPSHTEEEGNRS